MVVRVGNDTLRLDLGALREREQEEIENAKEKVDGSNALMKYLKDDRLEELYNHVYRGRGYAGLFESGRYTYYRKGSGRVPQYAYVGDDAVIVFLRTDLTCEGEFEAYTGMPVDEFLSAVQRGDVLPTRAKAEAYEGNIFYDYFFDRWADKVDDRLPVFANAVEEALHDGEGSGDDEEWYAEQKNDLEETAPSLAEQLEGDDDGGEIRPAPELPSISGMTFFAERLGWFEKLDLGPLSEAVKDALRKYERNASEEDLRFATRLAFSGHQVFTVKTFYAFGSAVTYSHKDVRRAKKVLDQLEERQQEESLRVSMYLPFASLCEDILPTGSDDQLKPSVLLPASIGGSSEHQENRRVVTDEGVEDARGAVSEQRERVAEDIRNGRDIEDNLAELSETAGVLFGEVRDKKTRRLRLVKAAIDTAAMHVPQLPGALTALNVSLETLSGVWGLHTMREVAKTFEDAPFFSKEVVVWETGQPKVTRDIIL